MIEIEIADEIRQNRIGAVAALRSADESKRLTGDAYDPVSGKMCACAVISLALGLPLQGPAGGYDYAPLERALDINATIIWRLNDDRRDGQPPRHTFAQIGDQLAGQWGLE